MGKRDLMRVTVVILSMALMLSFSSVLFTAPVSANSADPVKIVIDVSHGQGPSDADWTGHKLEALMADLEVNLTTVRGHTVVWATEINETVLSGAQFLFLGSVYGVNLTDAEVTVIKNWFEGGEKALWIAADSDYGAASWIALNNTNKVLEAIGSKLRAEPTSVEDPISNAAGAYRVIANVTNTVDAEVASIVAGVNATKGVLFHGPTILYGVNATGDPVALETTTLSDVYWVMKTGAAGIIVDHDLIPPLAHTNGQEGSFVIMAVEVNAGPDDNSRIIVSGENFYGGYQPMYTWTYKESEMEGPILVLNAIDWGVEAFGVPVANAGADQEATRTKTVSFDGTGSTDNVGIATYSWDFGDGTTETGDTTTHVYTETGTFTVTLNVTDAAGNWATDTATITVNPTFMDQYGLYLGVVVVVIVIVTAAAFFLRKR